MYTVSRNMEVVTWRELRARKKLGQINSPYILVRSPLPENAASSKVLELTETIS